jgi:Domain of unknown function (DUF4431)
MAVALSVIAFTASAHAECLAYGGRVQISGTLERKIFPGPPEYESVAAGDAPEAVWLLKLDAPACVTADPHDGSGVNAAVRAVGEIQLLLAEDQYRTYANWLGGHAVLKGKLFGAVTGHHRTPVLLEAVEFGR